MMEAERYESLRHCKYVVLFLAQTFMLYLCRYETDIEVSHMLAEFLILLTILLLFFALGSATASLLFLRDMICLYFLTCLLVYVLFLVADMNLSFIDYVSL